MQKDLGGKIKIEKKGEQEKRIGQEQIYDLLVSRELSWQAIIYELIRTEQLNPWDIDLGILAKKYLETIQQLHELGENTFHVSSKVLLVAALLLRMKSETLHDNIRDIDEILFENKKRLRDELGKIPQIITLDEEDIPLIMPRTPLPRARKVTLPELMAALDKAINTEHRRIKKNFSLNRARHVIDLAIFPKFTFNLTKRIQNLFQKIKDFFSGNKEKKLTFSQLAPQNDKIEKIGVFLPLIHLDHQKKVYLRQESAFSDIEIYLRRRGEKFPEELVENAGNEECPEDYFLNDKVEKIEEEINADEELEQNRYKEEKEI